MNPARPFQKARGTNSSSANYPTWVTTELDPSFTDVGTAAGRCLTRLGLSGGGGVVPWGMQLFPYGLGSDNDVFSLKLVGYRRIYPQLADQRFQYLRSVIAILSCTISGAVGLAGGSVLNTERFADTISVTKEGTVTADVTRSGTISVYSPADDSPAYAIIPLRGFEGFEIEWDQTTGTPTMNALYSFIDGPAE